MAEHMTENRNADGTVEVVDVHSIDWARKLTSRKFWMAVTVLVSSILMAFNVGDDTVAKVTGIIVACADVLGYLLAEGLVDAASAASEKVNTTVTLTDSPECEDVED